MEKLGEEYPNMLQCYQHNQRIFETDDNLAELVLSLNLKSEVEKRNLSYQLINILKSTLKQSGARVWHVTRRQQSGAFLK